MRREALFSGDRLLRREIRRSWVATPTRWAAWLMLNPSDASADRDDPTALRVTEFTLDWGYDGWIGVNCYPFISSDPRQIWKWKNWSATNDWAVRDALQQNLEDIETVGREAVLRVVAFGASPYRDEPWLEQCLEAFGQPQVNGGDEALYCIGTTTSGAPKHPLARGLHRVPRGTKPIRWSRLAEATS